MMSKLLVGSMLVVVAVTGCKRKDAPTCTSTVDDVVPLLLPPRNDVPRTTLVERRQNLDAVLTMRCREDRWSTPAMQCIQRATSEGNVDACAEKLLTPDASTKLARVLAIEGLRLPPPPEPLVIAEAPESFTGIPECDEYRAGILELAKCPAIPLETRTQMLSAFDQAASAWRELPPEGKAAAKTACTAARDAVRQASEACPPSQ